MKKNSRLVLSMMCLLCLSLSGCKLTSYAIGALSFLGGGGSSFGSSDDDWWEENNQHFDWICWPFDC